MTSRFYSKPAYEDPRFSVDVFDRQRRNEWGRPYCVAAAVTPSEAKKIIEREERIEAMAQDLRDRAVRPF